jgi:hypothetical protein
MKFAGHGIHCEFSIPQRIPATRASAYNKIARARKEKDEIYAPISDATGMILSLSIFSN